MNTKTLMLPANLAVMRDAIDAHKGPLAMALRESRNRVEVLILSTPTSDARNAWTEANLALMQAEAAMQRAIKATLKLLD